MKKLVLVLRNSIIVFVLIIALYSSKTSYAVNIIDKSAFSGPVVLRDNGIIVTGDSYAGRFYDFERNKDLYVLGYAKAGQTIDQNKYIMTAAFDFNVNNVLISIGVNDQFVETPLYKFEYMLRSFLSVAILKNKTVYFHSYLKYFANEYNNKKFSSIDYDNIIRKLCEEYSNVYYIDVRDLETPYFIDKDNIHYNQAFYDELYERLVKMMFLVERYK